MNNISNDHLEYNPHILDDIPARIAKTKEYDSKSILPDSVEINDMRVQSEFKGISFSGYKKTEVRTQLVNSMLKGRIEPACNWCAELICAGHFADLWEIIINFMSKHIHIGNPKLAIYLEMRYNNFRNIMIQLIQQSELNARNHDEIRKLFSEIICILTLSIKKPSFEIIAINRKEEYDVTLLSEKIKAPSMEYVQPIFKQKDPRELFIALNEFAYCLTSDNSNMLTACYWIEWIIEFNTICKKRKDPIKCVKRSTYNVESKYQIDVIWLIWDILLHYAVSEKHSQLHIKTLNSLLRLFCIKYSTPSCKKRRYLLYYAVGLLTETISSSVELISNREILQNVTNKIDTIYKQIKKNEHVPKTDYLFNGLDKKRILERSMKQMEMVGQIDNSSIK